MCVGGGWGGGVRSVPLTHVVPGAAIFYFLFRVSRSLFLSLSPPSSPPHLCIWESEIPGNGLQLSNKPPKRSFIGREWHFVSAASVAPTHIGRGRTSWFYYFLSLSKRNRPLLVGGGLSEQSRADLSLEKPPQFLLAEVTLRIN